MHPKAENTIKTQSREHKKFETKAALSENREQQKCMASRMFTSVRAGHTRGCDLAKRVAVTHEDIRKPIS